jgi:hypothetical protein
MSDSRRKRRSSDREGGLRTKFVAEGRAYSLFITSEELDKLTRETSPNKNQSGKAKQERALAWANKVRSQAALLQMTLEGLVEMEVPESGEPVFKFQWPGARGSAGE